MVNNLFMLIGVAGCGKSTYRNYLQKRMDVFGTCVLSTDDYLEAHAKRNNVTYSEMFKTRYKHAEVFMYEDLDSAVADHKDIIWDQTNLTISTRKNKLAKIPDNYIRHAVAFYVQPAEQHIVFERVANREGKSIPPEIIANMFRQFELPSTSEGFDFIKIYSIMENWK